jgi:hypothetical protein
MSQRERSAAAGSGRFAAAGHELLSNVAWLWARYERDQMTLREIAPLIGCSHQRVATALERAGIARRARARRYVRPELGDASWLHHAYVVEGRNTVEIGAELDVTAKAVNKALRRSGISVRPPRHHPPA